MRRANSRYEIVEPYEMRRSSVQTRSRKCVPCGSSGTENSRSSPRKYRASSSRSASRCGCIPESLQWVVSLSMNPNESIPRSLAVHRISPSGVSMVAVTRSVAAACASRSSTFMRSNEMNHRGARCDSDFSFRRVDKRLRGKCPKQAAQREHVASFGRMIAIREKDNKRLRPWIDPERAAGPTRVTVADERKASAARPGVRRVDVPAEAPRLPDRVGRLRADHEAHSLGFEKSHAVKLAFVEQHSRISRKIARGREKSRVSRHAAHAARGRIVDGSTRRAAFGAVSYTHLRAHETPEHLVCRL